MKAFGFILLLSAIGWLSNCQAPKKDDPEILKQIIVDYFDGIKNQDINKLNSVTTSDFVLFEDGKVWNNDSLIRFRKTFPSFKGEWKFDNWKINVDESSGDVVYYDHGDFVLNDTLKMQFDWLESATFRKINGEWKMNLLHSSVKKKQ